MASYNPQVFVPAAPPVVDPIASRVQALEANLNYLNERDRGFALSLITFHKTKGFLSEKQAPWIYKLLERAQPAKPATPPVGQQLGSGFPRVIELFDRAKAAGLANPKIRLETQENQKVVLRLLGTKSKFPGNVSVTDAGSSFETRRYFGRIGPTGIFYPSPINIPDVTKLLEDLAADPAKMAALYGHKTSSCCFCALPLRTRESVAMGYGPICAENYGLPWGEIAPPTYTKMTLENNDGP